MKRIKYLKPNIHTLGKFAKTNSNIAVYSVFYLMTSHAKNCTHKIIDLFQATFKAITNIASTKSPIAYN